MFFCWDYSCEWVLFILVVVTTGMYTEVEKRYPDYNCQEAVLEEADTELEVR